MLDCISLGDNAPLSATVVDRKRKWFEVWLTRVGKQTELLFCNENCWQDYRTLLDLDSLTITACCAVDDLVYLGDSKANVHVYSTSGVYNPVDSFR